MQHSSLFTLQQVRQEAADVAAHCGSEISVTALTADAGPQLKRAVATAGQLVVSTPGGEGGGAQSSHAAMLELGPRIASCRACWLV